MPEPKNPQDPKNKKTWISITRDFVKEWPEILEGLEFTNLPIRYVNYINVVLKNKATVKIVVSQELKTKSQKQVANWIKEYINNNQSNIDHVEIKFDVPKLKGDMENKTDRLLSKTFKKI